MKYGIFSDIHANLDAFERVLAFLEKEGVEEYVCCGDIVGYNANPDECVSLVVDMGMQAIMGNHDKALIDPIEERYFNQYGLTAIRWQRARVKPSNQTFLKNLPQDSRSQNRIHTHSFKLLMEVWIHQLHLSILHRQWKHFGCLSS